MIRNLLATTAIATLVATGAFAQDAAAPAPADPATTAPAAGHSAQASHMMGEGYLATQIIGEDVYNGTGDDAQNVGEVSDIVIGPDGNIQAVVIGVGGFLGIGQKDVAVDFAELDWAERNGDRWLVAPMTKEQLEAQAVFDRSAFEAAKPMASNDTGAAGTTAPAGGLAPATDTTAEAPANTTQPVPETTAQGMDTAAPNATADAPADKMAQNPAAGASTDTTTTAAIDKSTLKELPAANIRAEEMVGTVVYGANDERVGEIGDVALASDGKIDAYILDVGGFLGVGEKEVAVGSDNLAFMTDADGNKYLYTTFTKEQLDAAAAYDKGTYADKRDNQRLMMTR